MDESPSGEGSPLPPESPSSPGGWTVLRVIGLVVGTGLMVSFGLCGFVGVGTLVSEPYGAYGSLVLTATLIGLFVAALGGLLVFQVVRRIRGRRR